jgi:hypothetical protein
VKYVITWTPRAGGSAVDNEQASFRFLQLMRNWTPQPETTFHQFVLRADGEGGFAVVDADHSAIASTLFRFSPLFEYHAYPVIDSEEGLRIADQCEAEFRATPHPAAPRMESAEG